MCTRISIFAPTTTTLDALESWADDCGVGIGRVSGSEGTWRDTSILVTRSYCDCGTPIGSMSEVARHHDPDRALRVLRKRGWSEAKIARALAQQRDANQRHDAQRTTRNLALLTSWVTFLKGAPAHGRLKSIGIFYREDGRWLSAKDLEEAPRETSVLVSLEPLVLARLQAGVLHEFSADR